MTVENVQVVEQQNTLEKIVMSLDRFLIDVLGEYAAIQIWCNETDAWLPFEYADHPQAKELSMVWCARWRALALLYPDLGLDPNYTPQEDVEEDDSTQSIQEFEGGQKDE